MRLKDYLSCALLLSGVGLSLTSPALAQGRKLKTLFIGNSFTATNDLPLTTANIARAMGDTLVYDSYAPGGCTFERHTTEAATLSKIALGDWNFVVLQEQSQRPAFSDAQVADEVFPYAHKLDSLVDAQNPCGRSIFYMTWGYPDGDPGNCPFFPPICTYAGMDSMLALRYTQMANTNKALLSPVGRVFKETMKRSPAINLFLADRMHPSTSGTYAGAVTFYTILFRRDPALITYTGGLPPADAAAIRNVVHDLVYTDLAKWHVGEYDPKAAFTATVSGGTATFNSGASANVIHYTWDFGDGKSASTANPVHTYTAPGTYHVRLIGDDCSRYDTTKQDVVITTTGISTPQLSEGISIYPNPAHDQLYVRMSSGQQAQQWQLRICNAVGQTISTGSLSGTDPIAIGTLSPGLYFLHLQNAAGERQSLKFIKE
jgi:hypothetical protein